MTQDQLKKLLSQSGIRLKIDGTYSGNLDNFVRLLALHTDYLDSLDQDQPFGQGMN